MKILVICITTLCLAAGIVLAEESRRENHVMQLLRLSGLNTKNVTLKDVTKTGESPLIIIKRSGTVVGYYCEEFIWEKLKVDAEDLGSITKIVFGYGDDAERPILFEIKDSDEIALWVAAYKKHTEIKSGRNMLIPTSKSAGFEIATGESGHSSICACSLALRFYIKGKEVIKLNGHLQTASSIAPNMRNSVLHELVSNKLPQKDVGDPVHK